MVTSVAFSSAVSGLHASARQFQVAAHNVVNANTEGFEAQAVQTVSRLSDGQAGGVSTQTVAGGGPVDYVREFVAMSSARNSYAANASVINTLDQTLGALFDITA